MPSGSRKKTWPRLVDSRQKEMKKEFVSWYVFQVLNDLREREREREREGNQNKEWKRNYLN